MSIADQLAGNVRMAVSVMMATITSFIILLVLLDVSDYLEAALPPPSSNSTLAHASNTIASSFKVVIHLAMSVAGSLRLIMLIIFVMFMLVAALRLAMDNASWSF